MRRSAWFIGGVVAAGALTASGGLTIVYGGLFDARASTPHGPIVAWATHTTMIHYIRRAAAPLPPSSAFTPAQTLAGFRAYEADCEVCHGGPGVAHAHWVDGMNPSPPYLLDQSRRWTPNQLFWIVRNGVKMTGMPAWGLTQSDAEVWNLVAFLEAMPDLAPADYQKMRTELPPPAPKGA